MANVAGAPPPELRQTAGEHRLCLGQVALMLVGHRQVAEGEGLAEVIPLLPKPAGCRLPCRDRFVHLLRLIGTAPRL